MAGGTLPPQPPERRAGFRGTLLRVIAVQLVTLALLGLLQSWYGV